MLFAWGSAHEVERTSFMVAVAPRRSMAWFENSSLRSSLHMGIDQWSKRRVAIK